VNQSGAAVRRNGKEHATPPAITDLLSIARDYASAAKAPATQKLYRFDFEIFVAWCEGIGRPALPAAPETVALYLAYRANAGSRPLSIGRMLTSISQAHKRAGYPSPRSVPVVQEVLKGIRRKLGMGPGPESADPDRRPPDDAPLCATGSHRRPRRCLERRSL
jgi:hypothetical protein